MAQTQIIMYNGWTNYETWCLNVHYDGAYQEDAERIYNESESDKLFSKEVNAQHELADFIKQSIEEEQLPDIDTMFYSDLLNGAISEINFLEIAGHYIEELSKVETD